MRDELPVAITFGNGSITIPEGPVYVSLRRSGLRARILGWLRRKPAPDYYNATELTWSPVGTSTTIVSITLTLPDGRIVDVPMEGGHPQWDRLPQMGSVDLNIDED